MGVLWPARRNPEPNVLGRLGQVIHWLALVGSALWVFACAGSAAMAFPYMRDVWTSALAAPIGALVIALAGRTVRYVLSAE